MAIGYSTGERQNKGSYARGHDSVTDPLCWMGTGGRFSAKIRLVLFLPIIPDIRKKTAKFRALSAYFHYHSEGAALNFPKISPHPILMMVY